MPERPDIDAPMMVVVVNNPVDECLLGRRKKSTFAPQENICCSESCASFESLLLEGGQQQLKRS